MPDRPTTMDHKAHPAGWVCAAAGLALLTGCGSSTTNLPAGAATTTGTPSTTPSSPATTRPTPTGPSLTPAGPQPTPSVPTGGPTTFQGPGDLVSATGVVMVNNDLGRCVLMTDGSTTYQLTGARTHTVVSGQRYTVTGHTAPGAMSSCHLGTLLAVDTLTRAQGT